MQKISKETKMGRNTDAKHKNITKLLQLQRRRIKTVDGNYAFTADNMMKVS